MSSVIKSIPKSAKFSTLSQLRQQVQEVIKPLPQPEYKFGSFSKEQNAFLDRVIRVDQAGELGADYIYAGQHFVLSRTEPQLKSLIQHMWDQEIYHRSTFNQLQAQRRVRPSLLTPIWKIGAFTMGAATALISKEAAMACTVAVETVIGGHYNDQLRILENKFNDIKVTNSNQEQVKILSNELQTLKDTIKTFRDDELEHLDTAIEHDAESAVPYWLITEIIKLTCRVAIFTAERV
ncbi:hypothetical protein WICMUC_005716 [Wickerhamomyces mucosus]|uniref:5-demethoxyubiquinone hydroxylase, mitochondrial n=1 Tax=Wickerhamomyces mucosus TaxID=1378264 RepID=A0A9P8P6S9_9ASCO|nr:hypothetical protein WICMUC_005716 [Wickerhamomyces mucosus]